MYVGVRSCIDVIQHKLVHIYFEGSPIMFNGAYSQISVHRIAAINTYYTNRCSELFIYLKYSLSDLFSLDSRWLTKQEQCGNAKETI